jgi:ubiquinone biosynthesis protein UbiJ
MEQVTQALGNAKRRISQRKGELADNLSDQITQELTQINQVCMQLFGEIQRLKHENEKLNKEKADTKALKK